MPEFMSLREAGRFAGVSHECIRIWAIAYGIGQIEDRRWKISRAKLEALAAARAEFQRIKYDLRQTA